MSCKSCKICKENVCGNLNLPTKRDFPGGNDNIMYMYFQKNEICPFTK